MHMRYHFIVLYILIQSSVVCMQGMERQLIDRGFQVGDDEEVELQFLCDECQRLFKTERGLKAHKTRKHTIQESQLENDSTYAGQSSVTPFQCDMCPCMFTTQRGLNNHQISQHGVPRDWSFHPPALSRLKRVPESVALDRAIYAAQVGPGIPKPLAGSPKDESDLRRRLELSPAYVADSPLHDAAAHKTTSGNSSPTIYFDTPTAAMARAVAVAVQRGSPLQTPLRLSSPSENDLRRLLESSPVHGADSPLHDGVESKGGSRNASPTMETSPMVTSVVVEKSPEEHSAQREQCDFEQSFFDKSITEIGLDKVVCTNLNKAGIKTIGDLVTRKEIDVQNLMYIGPKSLFHVKRQMQVYRLYFGMKMPLVPLKKNL